MSSPDLRALDTIEERSGTEERNALEDLFRKDQSSSSNGGGLGQRRGGRSVASAPVLPRTFDGRRPSDRAVPASAAAGAVSSRSARYNREDLEHLLPNLHRGTFGRYAPAVDRALSFARQNRALIGIVALLLAFTSLTGGGSGRAGPHISLITIQYSSPRAEAEQRAMTQLRQRGGDGGPDREEERGEYAHWERTDDDHSPFGSEAHARSAGGFVPWSSGGDGPPEVRTVHCGVSCGRSAARRPLRANPNERHAVKCCSASQNAGFIKRKRGKDWRAKDWCPYALVMQGEGDECSFRTYGDASDFCLMRGGRLCTARELEGECAAGVGCGFDGNHVWTSDGPGSGDETVDDVVVFADTPKKGAESLPDGGFYAAAAVEDGRQRRSGGDSAAAASSVADTIPGEYNYEADTLIHVLSPYRTNTPNPFGPVDFEQYTALVSLERARDAYNGQASPPSSGAGTQRAYDKVVVVCAILRIDMAQGLHYLLNRYCDRVVELPRSVPFVYPRHELRAVPFVQDLIDVAADAVGEDEYHLMLTNADISVGRNFYMDVDVSLRKRNANALSINRKGVGPKYPTVPTVGGDTFHAKHEAAMRSVIEAEELIRRNRFDSHPGYDCFVFHSSFLAGVDFGDIFLGVPWWATHVDLIGHIMGENYANLRSDELLLGTFHFGNSMGWMPQWASKVEELRDPDPWRLSFWGNFSGSDLELLLWCPILRYPPFDPNVMQNAVNCGRLFRPRSLGGDNVPSFVRAGHEGRFAGRYSGYLGYTSDGFPVAVGDQFRGRLPNVGPGDRLKWLQRYNSS